MNHHEYSRLFPMLVDADLQKLADDIRVNGLRERIVIDDNDLILDGRNREAACVIAGVTPEYEPFVGNDEQKLAFIVSANIHRRHLTTRQRAMVAGKLKPIYEAQAAKRLKATQSKPGKKVGKAPVNLPDPSEAGDARDKAGAALNVSGSAVDQAVKVIAKAVPEIVAAVESGALAVSAAAIVADMPEAKQKELIESGVAAVKEAAAEVRKADSEVDPVRRGSAFDDVKASDRINNFIKKEMERWPDDRHGEAIQTFHLYLGKFEIESETPALPATLGKVSLDRIHDTLAQFPEMDRAQQELFTADVEEYGQRTPVLIDEAGVLLDGRSRVIACQALGIPVRYEVFRGTESKKEAIVYSLNLSRRPMTISQLAMGLACAGL